MSDDKDFKDQNKIYFSEHHLKIRLTLLILLLF